MKSSNDTIGNRTRDPPAWSAVPQPTALPLLIATEHICRCTVTCTTRGLPVNWDRTSQDLQIKPHLE